MKDKKIFSLRYVYALIFLFEVTMWVARFKH